MYLSHIRERNKRITDDIAHASFESLETEMQNRYFSRYLRSPEARAISGRSLQCLCYWQVFTTARIGEWSIRKYSISTLIILR